MSNRPPISSSRLILRAFRPTDAEDLHVYLSDAHIYQFEPGEPISLEQAYKMAGELTSSPDFWAVELEETGRVIGQIYFKHTDPPHLQSWELGYILSPHYQRQGYMTEAVGALVRKRFSDGDIHRIVAHCTPKNIPSWWDNYYHSMAARIESLREKYSKNPEAQAILDLEYAEIELYHQYSAWYGYAFYLGQA